MPRAARAPRGLRHQLRHRHWHRLRRQWAVLTAISIGGGLGSVGRYLVGQAVPSAPGRLPWSTLLINVSGCLILGALNGYLLEGWPSRRYVRAFWAIGVLGGFTTFSTYTAELRDLLDRGALPAAGGYAFGSLVAGLAAVWAGVAVARLPAARRAANRLTGEDLAILDEAAAYRYAGRDEA
ncbi:MAG TPA: fluoride efflux transporter CrcB [Streptosporangiaceae bacterium]